ncbi:hypothetical protein HNR23_001726 [Nocardiopsis mwathae]|uniref:Uncharacterized protein n=1 Tax=Nocardiopsis mwathae TaxID=1472723 RepID=A0A7X0D5G3_9ACTN|nr:hypothetical protein [Nocardiopsis mwathae]MBB6171666.1 hypothetical protein [Nocardiopsis mwathae]
MRTPAHVIVTDDSVISAGREMTGAEVTDLARRIDRVRRATTWREMTRNFPIGCWVRSTKTPRPHPDQVIGYAAARASQSEHRLKVRSRRNIEVLMPTSEAERCRPPNDLR